jgi:hypothetical protein
LVVVKNPIIVIRGGHVEGRKKPKSHVRAGCTKGKTRSVVLNSSLKNLAAAGSLVVTAALSIAAFMVLFLPEWVLMKL